MISMEADQQPTPGHRSFRTATATDQRTVAGPEVERLLHQHRAKIYRFVRSRGLSIEDAEDLTQETLIRGYQHYWQFQGGSLGTWLCSIARNATLDYWRRKKIPTVPLDNGLGECSWSDDPAVLLLGTGMTAELRAVLEALRPEQRQMLFLRYIDQRSLEELAELLHCSPGAAAQRVFRSVTALRQLVAANRENASAEHLAANDRGPSRRLSRASMAG